MCITPSCPEDEKVMNADKDASPGEALCSALPAVAGGMECTIADHERRCLVLIDEEQRKANPDNAVIACLCDAVRLAREYVRSMQRNMR